MEDFTLGDLTLMEIALCQFMSNIDVNMAAGQQVQTVIGKIELKIGRLANAAKDQNSEPLTPPADLMPKA